MKLTANGHASLFVETEDQRILIDPVFADDLVGGAVRFLPERQFRLARMPEPSLLIVTHGHFDHFHLPSLERLPRGTPVLTSSDPEVLGPLRRAGFTDITVLEPGQVVCRGATRIEATPSEHDEPEFGVLLSDSSGAFWHMVDSEVPPQLGEQLRVRYGRIDVVAAKYQPIARSSMNHLRGMGSRVAIEEIFASFEAACACDPRWVFPYAFGVAFGGEHAWFNRYALAIEPAEAVRLLAARLGRAERAGQLRPGDVLELTREAIVLHESASPYVAEFPTERPSWEPVDTSTLHGIRDLAARANFPRELEAFLSGEFALWAARELGGELGGFLDMGVVWQLHVHVGGGQRLSYALDFRQSALQLVRGVHPEANYFVHLGGGLLHDVLNGKAPELLFWLTGQARIHEKVMAVRDGKFWRPPHEGWDLFDRLPDPVTRFLRLRGRAHADRV